MILWKRSEQRFLSDLSASLLSFVCLHFILNIVFLFAKLPNICPCETRRLIFQFLSASGFARKEVNRYRSHTFICCAWYTASRQPSKGYVRGGGPFYLTHVIMQPWYLFERCHTGGVGSSCYRFMVIPQCRPMDDRYPIH